MRKITADYIFPITSKPLKDGVITIDDKGTILDISPQMMGDDDQSDLEYHRGIIIPGFINCHCHLELSFFKGMLKEHTGLDVFIRDILALQRPELEVILKSIDEAENEMMENGIVAVGDISNGNTTYLQKAKRKMLYHTFIEVFAFDPTKSKSVFDNAVSLFNEYPSGLHKSITPHAPYSISDDLFRMIYDLFLTKTGTIYERIKSWGTDLSNFNATGKKSLPSVLHKMPESSKILLVHNTVTTEEDIRWATSQHEQLYWCFCPNANLYIEQKLPNFAAFINSKARCVVGTDSYASNWSLSILDELKTISKNAPNIPFETLLKWSTINGAEFLGYSDQLGSIEVGKQPGLNLLTDIDSNTLALTPDSKVKKII